MYLYYILNLSYRTPPNVIQTLTVISLSSTSQVRLLVQLIDCLRVTESVAVPILPTEVTEFTTELVCQVQCCLIMIYEDGAKW